MPASHRRQLAALVFVRTLLQELDDKADDFFDDPVHGIAPKRCWPEYPDIDGEASRLRRALLDYARERAPEGSTVRHYVPLPEA